MAVVYLFQRKGTITMQQSLNSGTLYIVSTPIGNLEDITLRALSVLKTVNVIAAEDTRHSKKLLQHFDIRTPVMSLHEHNEQTRANVLVERLRAGDSIALISDAGTPLISDPGYRLVQAVRIAHCKVVPIVGVCAAIAGLVVSGLSTEQFEFMGFLPAKGELRRERCAQALSRLHTVILYESTHRLYSTLELIDFLAPDRPLCLAKELTKQFESIVNGTAKILLNWLDEDTKRIQGEFVLIVEGKHAQTVVNQVVLDVALLLKELMNVTPLKQAVVLAVKLTGLARNALYQIALQIQ